MPSDPDRMLTPEEAQQLILTHIVRLGCEHEYVIGLVIHDVATLLRSVELAGRRATGRLSVLSAKMRVFP